MAATASGRGDQRHDPETVDQTLHLLWAHTQAPLVPIDLVCASACAHVSVCPLVVAVKITMRRTEQLIHCVHTINCESAIWI